MGKFREFLENEYILTEASVWDAVVKVKKVLKKHDRAYSEWNHRFKVKLPLNAKSLTLDDKKLIKECIKVADGKMINVRVVTGNMRANMISFDFPLSLMQNLRKCFHVTERKYLQSILKNGLIPHSNPKTLKYGASGSRKVIQTYKAIFVTEKISGTIKTIGYIELDYKDPVILEIASSGIEFWIDPGTQEDDDARLTFEKIPANKIKIYEN
jgi:hypothetical protein